MKSTRVFGFTQCSGNATNIKEDQSKKAWLWSFITTTEIQTNYVHSIKPLYV